VVLPDDIYSPSPTAPSSPAPSVTSIESSIDYPITLAGSIDDNAPPVANPDAIVQPVTVAQPAAVAHPDAVVQPATVAQLAATVVQPAAVVQPAVVVQPAPVISGLASHIGLTHAAIER
jgi:hypothetical protein